jgi:hypothetical protein
VLFPRKKTEAEAVPPEETASAVSEESPDGEADDHANA